MNDDAEAGGQPPKPNTTKKPASPSWEYQLREYLLLLSSVVAIGTYSAGLAPPGGVWQQDDDKTRRYKAGDPILGTGSPAYLAFYYCNATAFAASLVVNLLLLVLKETSTTGLIMLRTVMVLDVLALMAAYAAGSCLDLVSTIYVSTLVVALSAYLGIKIIINVGTKSDESTAGTPRPQTTMSVSDAGNAKAPDNDDDSKNLRRVLMLLATFATEITYTAGLSPPGGFQEDSEPGRHDAGDPTLQSGQSARLMAFYYCNTTAFVASLSIIVPLLSSRLQNTIYVELYGPTIVALLGLMGAYTAGSSREAKTIAYVLALIGAVLAYMLLLTAIIARKNWKSTSELARNENSAPSDGDKNEKKRRKKDFILLLATLAATITYQAGLDPPGGFSSKDDTLPKPSYHAGDPILLNTKTKHYKAFFYCNSTAFAASLVVILMVQSNRLTEGKALEVVMILDLLGLIGAYAAGCSRDVSTSIYVVALAGAVLVYVVIHIVFSSDQCNVSGQEEEEKLEKQRERLLILAILAATIAYKAGLTPPGGFWQEDNGSHHAGDPVLLDSYRRRYHAFFYCNAMSFMASVALIILLINPKLYRLGIKCYALYVCMVVGMFSLMGAYAAGSAREVQTPIYVIVLVGVVVAFLFVQLLVNLDIREVWKKLLAWSLKSKEQHEGSSGAVSSDAANSQETSTCKMDESSDMQKEYLMTLAILAASVTYQAGLQPPGGLSNEGNPMLHVTDARRYNAFIYCNSTSFVASIVVIILLLQQQYQKKHHKKHDFLLYAMNAVIVVVLLCLLGAYAAGSCREWETSGYVIGLAVFVFACIAIHFVVWYSNKEQTPTKNKIIDQSG